MTATLAIPVLSALRLFTVIPDGMRAVQVRRHHHGSPYRMDMFVVVEPANTAPADGVDFRVR